MTGSQSWVVSSLLGRGEVPDSSSSFMRNHLRLETSRKPLPNIS
jgi:hypothetical protein